MSQILNQLSDNLKEKLLIEANKIIMKDSPIFKNNFSERVIQKSIQLIKESKYAPEQIIYDQNDLDNCAIYFI